MQDLQDLRDGISISFEPEMIRNNKNMAKEKRKKTQQEKIDKLEKKLIKVGYWNMDSYSLDRVHADKWLTKERIEELEELHQKHAAEIKPEQISFFNKEVK